MREWSKVPFTFFFWFVICPRNIWGTGILQEQRFVVFYYRLQDRTHCRTYITVHPLLVLSGSMFKTPHLAKQIMAYVILGTSNSCVEVGLPFTKPVKAREKFQQPWIYLVAEYLVNFSPCSSCSQEESRFLPLRIGKALWH